jgi:hypothetical protein
LIYSVWLPLWHLQTFRKHCHSYKTVSGNTDACFAMMGQAENVNLYHIVTSELYAKMLRCCCHKKKNNLRMIWWTKTHLVIIIFYYKSKIIEFTHSLRLSITILFQLETKYNTVTF